MLKKHDEWSDLEPLLPYPPYQREEPYETAYNVATELQEQMEEFYCIAWNQVPPKPHGKTTPTTRQLDYQTQTTQKIFQLMQKLHNTVRK